MLESSANTPRPAQPATRRPELGPKALAWCRRNIPHFAAAHDSAKAVKAAEERSREAHGPADSPSAPAPTEQ